MANMRMGQKYAGDARLVRYRSELVQAMQLLAEIGGCLE